MTSKIASLKHKLKVCNTKLKDKLLTANRSSINWKFANNRKKLFRDWRGKQPEIVDPPTIGEIFGKTKKMLTWKVTGIRF